MAQPQDWERRSEDETVLDKINKNKSIEPNILATNEQWIILPKCFYTCSAFLGDNTRIELESGHSVWKSQKKSHSTLRAKRATFTFLVDKSKLKMSKMVHFGEFLKTCGQTVLPDKLILIGQKLVENVKMQTFKCDILSIFQTMWESGC